MKRCALCLLLTLAMVSGLQAVQVVRIWPGYRTADSFESIGEFFGRPEFTGGRIVLRSKAEDRTGFYFLTCPHSPFDPAKQADQSRVFEAFGRWLKPSQGVQLRSVGSTSGCESLFAFSAPIYLETKSETSRF